MSGFWNYHRTQLKRSCKVFPTILCMTLILLAGIGLLGFLILSSNQMESDETKKYQIGVVGDASDPYLSMGIAAVSELDSSRFMLEFVMLEEAEAIEGIRTGDISAYLMIPDGFVDSVMTGENKKILFVSSEGTVDISTILLNEVVGIVSEMITESQAAGSGLYKVMKQNDIQDTYHTYADMQDIKTAMMILTRTDIYEVETYRGEQSISLAGYYVSGIALFFLLIWGINASSILAEKNQSMQKLLKTRGCGILPQVIAEYAAYFVLLLLSVLVLVLLAWAGMKLTGKTLVEWEYATEAIVFRFFLQMIPVLLVVSAIHFLLYECTTEIISGILLQFIAALSLAYISGCFYPISFFPDLMEKISRFLPTGIALNYMCDCMMEKNASVEGIKLIVYMILFIGISALIRSTRLSGAQSRG